MLRLICFTVLFLVTASPGTAAQQFDFATAARQDSGALSKAMSMLAKALMASYKTDDTHAYLENLFRLQIVAGQYEEAGRTLTTLRNFRAPNGFSGFTYPQYDIYLRAKIMQAAAGVSFDAAFTRAFVEVLKPLDNRASALVVRTFSGVSLPFLEADFRRALTWQAKKTQISLVDALTLIRAYQLEEMYRAFSPVVSPLIAADDGRRYRIDNDVLINSGAVKICALVVRPRSASERLTALLNFTIYADRNAILNEARRTASNGYIGVEALTRGKGCSPDKAVPYEHDGDDARAVIGWISRQTWSDGRVGMYGGSYEGFTQWAAAKHLPRALKALMTSVTNAPGVDTPMEGNVFQSFFYPWPLYVTSGQWLDANTEGDTSRFMALEHKWYVSGKSYRSMDEIDGIANPFWDRWLRHPSYDAYWQNLLPYQKDFARINIPVLTTDGYYDGGQVGGLYYFQQYHKYNPTAENYLVMGPYDHIAGQRGTVSLVRGDLDVVAGVPIDPVAHIDIGELRYQWFDHLFKGAPKPAILKDRVNYEVMGANEWKHAPSIDSIPDHMRRFYLLASRSGHFYDLSQRIPAKDASIAQTVNLANRSDVDRTSPSTGFVSKALDTYLAVTFESAPFDKPFDLSGLFSGHLDFMVNKRDFDFQVSLFELTPKGEYISLSNYMARASYVQDRSRRHLLTPDKRERLDFKSGRLTSRRFESGSRLVVMLNLIKQPDIQINYGTGKDVSDETIADAASPLKIEWFQDSFVNIPVCRL